MAAPAYCFTTLKIDLEKKPEEITICCNGRITAESAAMLQREVRDRSVEGKGFFTVTRILLDLSNVTHIDNAGLQALLAVCTAGQNKSCTVEVINHRTQATKSGLARMNLGFRKISSRLFSKAWMENLAESLRGRSPLKKAGSNARTC